MSSLSITTGPEITQDVVAGPELFEPTTITVIDGLKIEPRPIEGLDIHGIATLFRLGGESFGQMHELTRLSEHEGRLTGHCTQQVEVGALVTIGWEDNSRCACRGVVCFSIRTAEGWRVTVELDSALAA